MNIDSGSRRLCLAQSGTHAAARRRLRPISALALFILNTKHSVNVWVLKQHSTFMGFILGISSYWYCDSLRIRMIWCYDRSNSEWSHVSRCNNLFIKYISSLHSRIVSLLKKFICDRFQHSEFLWISTGVIFDHSSIDSLNWIFHECLRVCAEVWAVCSDGIQSGFTRASYTERPWS